MRIDARGLYATPGFIDAHSHLDLAPFDEEAAAPALQQGITTAVVGQCGFSPAPIPLDRQAGWRDYFIVAEGGRARSWERFASYLRALREAGSPVSLLPFAGHGSLRYAVKGDDPAPCSAAERGRMGRLLEEAAAEGARGLSLGLIYLPALYADRKELEQICTVAARLQMPVSIHLRSESDELLQALRETVRLSRISGARFHISHLKSIGGANRYKMREALRLIEAADLSFDIYPYTFGSTSLLTLLPPACLRRRSSARLLAQLDQPDCRAALLPLLRGLVPPPPGEPWDDLIRLVGWEGIVLTELPEGPYAPLEGLSLKEAARRLSLPPEEALLQLLARCGAAARFIDHYSDEETLLTALRHPRAIFSTDTLPGRRPHPRGAGSFPRILRRYVLDSPQLSMEEAVARMSGRSAELFGLTDRGRLAAGYRADLLLFGPEIRDRATPEKPREAPEGLRWLFVAGETVIRRGCRTGARPGGFPGDEEEPEKR
jgi:N-acyl-D-aspartate/D-glutamate deacylase